MTQTDNNTPHKTSVSSYLFDRAELIPLCRSVAYFSLCSVIAITSVFVILVPVLNTEHHTFDNDVVVNKILKVDVWHIWGRIEGGRTITVYRPFQT